MSSKIQLLGMAWYHREDYEKLFDMFSDSHLLPKTYDDWLDYAEEGINRLSKDGFTIEKVYIDPKTFPSWCRENGFEPDAMARIAFTDDFISQKYPCGEI